MKRWSPADVATMVAKYRSTPTHALAAELGRSVDQVYRCAYRLGLSKTAAYLSSPAGGRIPPGSTLSGSTQFQPGNKPWCAGLKGVVGVHPKSRRHQFVKGAMPHNTAPVGAYRIRSDGFVERKTCALPGRPDVRWQPVHRLVWIAANGPVPPGHIIVFRTGCATTDPARITLDAVQCITMKENMARNSVHVVYPPALVKVAQLRGVLTRAINQTERNNKEAQDK